MPRDATGIASAFVTASLGSLVPFAAIPGLHGMGWWVDLYFLLITIQCGGTLVFFNVLAGQGGERTSCKARTVASVAVLSLGFVTMGVLDGILGVYAACPGECPHLFAGFFAALSAIFILQNVGLRAARGSGCTVRGRVVLAGLSSFTTVVGALGYWALGWSFFFPIEAGANVLLYKVGHLSLSMSGGDLSAAIAVTPILHATFSALSLRYVDETSRWRMGFPIQRLKPHRFGRTTQRAVQRPSGGNQTRDFEPSSRDFVRGSK